MCRAGGVAGVRGGGSALLLLLVLAGTGGGVRADAYADYSGVKLPHYVYETAGGAADDSRARDDYRDPLDYSKYDEQRPPTALPRERDAEDVWHPKAEVEAEPGARRALRPRKTRRQERVRADDVARRRRPKHPDDERQELNDASTYKPLDDNFGDEEIQKFEPNHNRRRSKERRDVSEDLTRALVGGRGAEERRGRGRRGKQDSDGDYELPPAGEEQYPHGLDEPHMGAPPVDRELTATATSAKLATRAPLSTEDPSDEYSAYDVMKPVLKLKDKLPSLLQRTTPSRIFAVTTPVRQGPRARWPSGSRRFHEPPQAPKRAKLRATTAELTTNTTITEPTTTTAKTRPQLNVTSYNMSELLNPHKKLSLAEKSRLSILKKAMMKESGKESATMKPPVLLQVTGGSVPTVVMVEPHGTNLPFSEQNRRYLLAMDESPQRLLHVKRLMRQKLLSRARGISDLTDNWDEQVCDYIDTAQLNRGANHPLSPAFALGIASTYVVFAVISY